MTPVDDDLCRIVTRETDSRCGSSGDILLEPTDLERGEDGGVVAGHDVCGTAVGRIDDARARVRLPQNSITVRRNIDTNLGRKK